MFVNPDTGPVYGPYYFGSHYWNSTSYPNLTTADIIRAGRGDPIVNKRSTAKVYYTGEHGSCNELVVRNMPVNIIPYGDNNNKL